jgi:hypothetical protein
MGDKLEVFLLTQRKAEGDREKQRDMREKRGLLTH